MTLILAQASRWFALEVTDRLVSQGGKAFDSASNKNLLLLNRDAVLAVGYTGAAYIDGLPTDHWLAEALSGRQLGRGTKPVGIVIGGATQARTIGPLLRGVAEALTLAFAKPRMRNVRASGFEVLISGFQWSRRKGARPVVIEIAKSKVETQFSVNWSMRHLGRQFMFARAGQDLTAVEQETMRTKLRGIRSVDDAEKILTETVRSVSRRLPDYVGPDCMSILIGPPARGSVRIRYISASKPLAIAKDRLGVVMLRPQPATFSPWIITPGLVQAPSLIVGGGKITAGTFTIDVEAPPLSQRGLLHAISSVKRPPSPV